LNGDERCRSALPSTLKRLRELLADVKL